MRIFLVLLSCTFVLSGCFGQEPKHNIPNEAAWVTEDGMPHVSPSSDTGGTQAPSIGTASGSNDTFNVQ